MQGSRVPSAAPSPVATVEGYRTVPARHPKIAVVRDIIPCGRRCEDRLAIRLRGLFCRLAVVKRAAAPWMSKKHGNVKGG
jgi:hypothetical protein